MKKLLKFFGLYTKKEFDEVVKYGAEKTKENKELRFKENAAAIYITELKKRIISLPFEFENLIFNYSKDQINALTYELINTARNTPEYRELLQRWMDRIKNAIETIDPNYGKDKKEAIDYK